MFLGWLQYLTAGCGGITKDFFEMRMNSQLSIHVHSIWISYSYIDLLPWQSNEVDVSGNLSSLQKFVHTLVHHQGKRIILTLREACSYLKQQNLLEIFFYAQRKLVNRDETQQERIYLCYYLHCLVVDMQQLKQSSLVTSCESVCGDVQCLEERSISFFQAQKTLISYVRLGVF